MEVDKVANMVADMDMDKVAAMVADVEVDKVADIGNLLKQLREVFLGDLSQICLLTHPPHGFCEIWENDRTRNQINDTFLFQNRVKVKVVGEVSEK